MEHKRSGCSCQEANTPEEIYSFFIGLATIDGTCRGDWQQVQCPQYHHRGEVGWAVSMLAFAKREDKGLDVHRAGLVIGGGGQVDLEEFVGRRDRIAKGRVLIHELDLPIFSRECYLVV
jgi:hypothetical protein